MYLRSTDNVTIGVWYTETTSPPSDKLVLYFHGNGEHRGWAAEKTRMYMHLPFHANVLGVDYRGFGDSTFVWPTEPGLYDDARTAYTHALAMGFPPHRILVHGYSLGSAVAARLVHTLCHTHATGCPGGLLLEAPFTSIPNVVQDRLWFNLSAYIHHPFPTQDILGDIPVPILIVHGTHDRVVPFRHGATLATMNDQTIVFCPVDGGTHMTSFDHADTRACALEWSQQIWRTRCRQWTPTELFQKRFLGVTPRM
ncbi:Aste57867_4711 [Aphanomyces stellatus]|uniref:Aste57867_4711 protein n=1 Tax=Aphanomyces stellatus TaxID=120398 RepID=A0A485KC83_9STRA|nr:hypothetical protein As57867_004698 [Aphanomyces stellatus]VFT81811.1 Aste57867_4711 [Aphanomyces stellatus]